MKSTFLLVIFFCIGCASRTVYPETTPSTLIEFGHGGGFAGIEYRYELLEDGRIFSFVNDQHTFLDRIPKKTADQLFANIDKLAKSALVVDKPGNTYGYIKWTDDATKARFIWDSADRSLNQTEFKINHGIMMQFVASAPDNKTTK